MAQFDPFGYGRQLAEISGQISSLTNLVKKQGATIMATDQAVIDLQTQTTLLIANVSNLTGAVNLATQAIDNELAIINDPNSSDAQVESAAQSIAAQNKAISDATTALATEVGKVPPVSTIDPPPAPTPAPAPVN